MADKALNTLPSTSQPTNNQDMLLFDETSNKGQRINYNTLADTILEKLTTKAYALDLGNESLIAQINKLKSDTDSLNNLISQVSNGTPTPVNYSGQMTDKSKLYLYTGTETGFVSGDVYYYNGSSWVDGGKYGFDSDAVSDAVQDVLAQYLAEGKLADLTIGDGTISRSKVDTSFESTLAKADSAMQPSVYDTNNRQTDIFSYVDGKVGDITDELTDGYTVDSSHIYAKIGDAIRGALILSKRYTDDSLGDYKAFTIKIVNSLPTTGDTMTFYLLPNNSNTGYDKYWWITDNDGNSKWDVFGSSSTLVVTELPTVGDEDTDYILKSSAGCLYYKYIDNSWQIIAGSIASVVSELPQIGSEFTDYYVQNESGVYIHYRYINGEFCAIGADSLSQDDIDELLSPINHDITNMKSDIQANSNNINTLSSTVTGLSQTVNNLDTEGYTYYASLSQDDNSNYIYTLYEVKDEEETVKSQFTLPAGSGGGGGGSATNLVVEKITASPVIATPTDSIEIQINYSSTDADGEQIDGTYSWKIGSNIVQTGPLVQGLNSFDLTEYCTIGTQKLVLTVTDQGGSVNVKSWTVRIVDIRIESTFNDTYTYEIGKSVNFTYTPYGAVSKTVHFILDGKEIGTVNSQASGTLQSYTLPAQSHGAHLLETYITATVNNMQIETQHIFKDIIWFDATSDVPVIGCIYRYDHYGKYTAKQYNTTSIPYVVYDSKTSSPNVTLTVDGVVTSSLKLSQAVNTWAYKSDEIAEHILVITCRSASVTIHINVVELGYDIAPITANLEFDFNPVGYSNSGSNRLWVDENNSEVQMTVSDNFDWSNGGYQLDDDGNQYFCVKAGTRAYISYNLFGKDPKQQGAEFKCIFRTKNVRNNKTTFLSCMPTADNIKVGLEMNAHEAYVHTSTSKLYTPYSEEDIIEYEYNINILDTQNADATSYIMSYEDGVGARPLLYDDSHRIYQYNPVPITIGSDDCDVHIYRMKAYSSSLTDSDILKNFIADSRDSETMINRYERNQIYDENNALTPESVAAACPDLKIIKIDCPHFTNDKKDYVKYTNVECIHKNGDPILDNWKFVNGYHAGRTLAHYLQKYRYIYCGRKLEC